MVDDFNTYDFSKAPANTRLAFIESPTNPLLTVTDIRRVAAAAKARGILTVVDNTFLTSYLQKPLDLGADIVVYSATKYYAGHSDLLAGFVVLNDDTIYERLRIYSKALGGFLTRSTASLLPEGSARFPFAWISTTVMLSAWRNSSRRTRAQKRFSIQASRIIRAMTYRRSRREAAEAFFPSASMSPNTTSTGS